MTDIKTLIGKSWYEALGKDTLDCIKEKYDSIMERSQKEEILPLESKDSGIFYALKITPFDKVKVLIIGQDPYPNREDAHGLAFSKKSGKIPASLKNIFEKIYQETGIQNTNGNLTSWAEQGVLMLNRALTYTKTESLTKRNKYWAPVTDRITEVLIKRNKPLVIMLWGNPANEIEQFSFEKEEEYKKQGIYILRSSHPSNMGNAKNSEIMNGKIKAFMQVPNFTRCNEILKSLGEEEIIWQT